MTRLKDACQEGPQLKAVVQLLWSSLLSDDSYHDVYTVSLDNQEWIARRPKISDGFIQFRVFPFYKDKRVSFQGISGVAFQGQSFSRFAMLLALPTRPSPGEAVSNLDAENIVWIDQIRVNNSGESKRRSWKNPKWEDILKRCPACQDQGPPLSYLERKVGARRCWKCTGIALGVGLSLSVLAAIGSPWLFKALGLQGNLNRVAFGVFILGALYTVWRAFFWGYLPYQNWIAWYLERKQARRRSQNGKEVRSRPSSVS